MRYCSAFFFFNDTATTEIYTLSLHDALPISSLLPSTTSSLASTVPSSSHHQTGTVLDRKSTRLNSSHSQISYAVFCLKKKKINARMPMSSYTRHYICIASPFDFHVVTTMRRY